jgi:UDP-N-acetyl-2-amino-2-deoxyglucuronate dehydrogenase
MNIGVHFFDLLGWLFGKVEASAVHLAEPARMAGSLELERARVRWFLSVDGQDLPAGSLDSGRPAFRSLTLDGEEVEFSEGFADLHTRVYAGVLAGRGYGIEDARPSIELVHRLRHAPVTPRGGDRHPALTR